ncbi:MAG: dGTP triphosphohydrolase [Chloroflexota bacterium]
MKISRSDIEQREKLFLAPYANKSVESRGRTFLEEDDQNQTCFQKDRERIIGTTAFRRLQNKTQVFMSEETDYHRNRLTHTVEVVQIARRIARGLALNEDLAECIALAHDLGHPPFGHTGEEILNSIMSDFGGFDHNIQTYRIVTEIEQKISLFHGLNLSWEVLEGIAKHGSALKRKEFHNLEPNKQASLESQIIDFADEIAYTCHDLDDGFRYGFISPFDADLRNIQLWTEDSFSSVQSFTDKDQYKLIQSLKEYLIDDFLFATGMYVEETGVKSVDDIRSAGLGIARFSQDTSEKIIKAKSFLMNSLYIHPRTAGIRKRVQKMIRNIFQSFLEKPELLPNDIQIKIANNEKEKGRVVCDYVAGMTDKYLERTYNELFSIDREYFPVRWD